MALFSALAAGAALVGAGVSAYGDYKGGQAQTKAQQQQSAYNRTVADANYNAQVAESEYQRQVDENNTKYQRQSAENERITIRASIDFQRMTSLENQATFSRKIQETYEEGDLTEQIHFKQVRSLSASQRASFASNGILINEGSALDILGDTAAQGETDAILIRSNVERKAQSFKDERTNFERESDYLEDTLEFINMLPLPSISIAPRPAVSPLIAPPASTASSSASTLRATGSLLSAAGAFASRVI